MKNIILHKISLYLSICLIGFIASYSLIIGYQFPEDQINYLFSLFYMVLSLNFLGGNLPIDNRQERIKLILTNTQSVIISCVLSILFALILIQSNVTIVKIFMILILSILVYYSTIIFLSRKVTLVLFWINFYLFMGIFVFSQFPDIEIDIISRVNPFGGLLITLFT
jgi:hypothetical protein